MAKLTLLAMVQDILNDTGSDPVNSINDTPEALQVAQIIKTTYYNLVANRNWPQEKRSFVPDNVSDTATPTHLKLPSACKELVSLFYDQRRDAGDRKQLQAVTYLSPEEFLDRSNTLNETNTTVDLVVDFGGVTFKIRNDIPPMWWTSFDDEYLVFNSYDSTVESTVQNSNSQATGYFEEVFTLSDTFVPTLPTDAFSSLLNEAKASAFLILRQEINPRVEREAQRQRTWLSRKAFTAHGGVKYPNYGRKGVRSNPQFDKT
jgi:hypothetical protein